MEWRRRLRRWRYELGFLLAVVLLAAVFLVERLHGPDFGSYADELNDMTLECRRREKAHPRQDCDACCRARSHPDIKRDVFGEEGWRGCTCQTF